MEPLAHCLDLLQNPAQIKPHPNLPVYTRAVKAKHFHPICNCRPLPDDLTKIGKFSVQCGVLR